MNDRAFDDEDIRNLRASILELPTDQRVVVVLHYFCGTTAAQIARMLGIKRGAVLTRLHRARLRIRTLMDDESCRAA